MAAGSFTLLCRCILHAPTMEQALHRALRFLRVVLDDPRGELVAKDGLAQILLTDAGEARSVFRLSHLLDRSARHHLLAGWPAYSATPRGLPLQRAGPQRRLPSILRCARTVRATGQPSCLRCGLPQASGGQDRTRAQKFLRSSPANILVRYRYDAGLSANIRSRLRHGAAYGVAGLRRTGATNADAGLDAPPPFASGRPDLPSNQGRDPP